MSVLVLIVQAGYLILKLKPVHLKEVIRIYFLEGAEDASIRIETCCPSTIYIQWRYSPTGPWPTERPPQVSEASANFCG